MIILSGILVFEVTMSTIQHEHFAFGGFGVLDGEDHELRKYEAVAGR